MQAEPDREWRIVTSDEHSTVWDGNNTLFDINFSALGLEAEEAFDLAVLHRTSMVLPVGKKLKVFPLDVDVVDECNIPTEHYAGFQDIAGYEYFGPSWY